MAVDPCSLSNPHEVVVNHWSISASPDFSTKTITATLTVRVTVLAENATSLVLDTRDLTINSVKDVTSDQMLSFNLQEVYKPCPSFGSALVISLPQTALIKGSTATIAIDYQTSPQSTAVQWLEPAQTAGKEHPYLFTQCQAIHARSLLPCQDTPSVKSTYSAKIKVPKKLTALMSAIRQGDSVVESEPEFKVYNFEQKVPMASYLVALVVGALESRKIGPRTHVWSEKEVVDKAAAEFSQTEDMLQAAEAIVGPYLWGVYDLLVLPPSFPYGGMENPCLTFVTPTLLAGDKSLANVIAHEISHSWTGNLVTNRNWEHFWLNEGITRYVESLIVAAVWGEKERHLQAMLGWKSLQDAIEKFGPSSPLTALIPPLHNIDPDDAFSAVPYEKGFSLLYHLETLVGLEKMKSYMFAHVEHFKYKTIITEEWKMFFLQYFQQESDDGLFDSIDWEVWFHSPGMPPVVPQLNTAVSDVCTALANKWTNDKEESFSPNDISELSSTQIQEFLNQLLNKEPLSVQVLSRMQEIYKMNEKTNSEIKFRWLRLCLRGGWTDVFPLVVAFLLEQGRMKFVRPLYRELYKCSGGGQVLAVETFTANRGIYHNITSNLVAKDLNIV